MRTRGGNREHESLHLEGFQCFCDTREQLGFDGTKVLVEKSSISLSTKLNPVRQEVRKERLETACQREPDGGSTLLLATARQPHFGDGHLHRGDDVPTGIAQCSIEIKYNQFCAHELSCVTTVL